ncbi:maspardin-like isoform X1 [Salvia divinorum]|uniref:Maspardin n=1 Tax=Salvia divinorum TaxID=28513 RepID=A0ABD1IN05_SALDI
MKGSFSVPGDYIYFKSQVPLHKIPIGSKQWRYYDFGPKYVPPLICLPGIAGTADVYYKQIMSLSNKGYRVISVDIPRVWNNQEWIQAFEKFLDVIDVHHIHLYGTSLGGFLAQLFAQHRPRRVKSLVLSNTFLETSNFSAAMPWAPIVGWAPSFLLKRYVLTGIRDGPHEPFIADSVDFVVAQVETLSKDDLASRLSLTVDSASIGPLRLSDTFITIMDTNDFCAVPQELKDQVTERYPGARQANLKSGGDFPFLSRPDEVNLHLQLHLRRVGVEAQPELVQGTNRDVAGESSSDQNNERGGVDDESKDERRDYIGATNENSGSTNENESPLALETPFLGSFDNQILRNVHLSNDE